MAVETEAATAPDLAVLADTDINWDRLDKTRFHIIGAILFSAQSALLHPTAVVKTRMQVDGSGLSHMRGVTVFRQILKNDGIRGIFRGFGTSAVGSLPGRVLALTSLEVSKDMMLKYTEHLNMSETTRVGIANGVAGMMSNLVSCVYFVPLEVVCQRLMVQGLPGTTFCNGPYDVVRKVIKAEGIRGMYRGFGLTAVTQSPASALWWGAYGAAQHIIWRSLGYTDNMAEKPSHMEMVPVQATAGLLAGACSSVITTPLDTVKTRLQVMDDYGVGRPSVVKTAKTLLKEDGWRGFYRGHLRTDKEIVCKASLIICGEGESPSNGISAGIVTERGSDDGGSRQLLFRVLPTKCIFFIRPLRKHYFQNTQGLIFVVDSNGQDLAVEARNELHRVLNEVETFI
ncbi:hypothetical protein Vadar_021780 [Vaccinium darrowii]|uniref:Uncharacterized protein n=1 Tax=Vaccinium darrowii TaxID=229202 RepID=A0ACB7XSV8_9ERIC|nr:hypothetical protein Vadar_021780 [Vaccinium darrowii]